MKKKKYVITFLIALFISVFSRAAFAQTITYEEFQDMLASGDLIYGGGIDQETDIQVVSSDSSIQASDSSIQDISPQFEIIENVRVNSTCYYSKPLNSIVTTTRLYARYSNPGFTMMHGILTANGPSKKSPMMTVTSSINEFQSPAPTIINTSNLESYDYLPNKTYMIFVEGFAQGTNIISGQGGFAITYPFTTPSSV